MNYVIFGQGRTGSTLLVRLLQSHPQLQCDGEMLHPRALSKYRSRWLRAFLRYFPEPFVLWRASRSDKPAYGFKLLYRHVVFPARLLFCLRWLGWKIIHIQRRTLFDVALSRKVAQTTKHWSDHDASTPEDLHLTFSPEEFLDQMQWSVNILRQEVRALRGIPHIPVVYEDDLLAEADRQRICNVIFAALRLEPHEVSTTKQRTWNRPYPELITNYAELQSLTETDQGRALQTEWELLINRG